MLTIENQFLKVTINLKGAELSSIINKENGKEYLWQADPSHWPRHSPILFPIVGRLRNDEFFYNGMNYSLSQHGVARDLDFSVVEQKENSALFELRSNPEIRIAYPFKFLLQVGYELKENTININYQVTNKDHSKMYFSIGAHPGFNCPLNEDEKRSDYSLVFEKKETLSTQQLKEGIRADQFTPVLDDSNVILIEDNLFDNDALIFRDVQSESITLQNGDEKLVSVNFKGFPYLGIWSKSSDSPFICIEPWYGVADHEKHNHKLEEKEGILSLDPKNHFKASYSISIH